MLWNRLLCSCWVTDIEAKIVFVSVVVMAESKSTIVPLCRSNYPAWKLQCRMTLMKHGLWSIVDLDGSETAPAGNAGQDAIDKFAGRKDKALALVVLSVEPSLLYLLGEPDDPGLLQYGRSSVISFRKNHAWANKLELRCMLYSFVET